MILKKTRVIVDEILFLISSSQMKREYRCSEFPTGKIKTHRDNNIYSARIKLVMNSILLEITRWLRMNVYYTVHVVEKSTRRLKKRSSPWIQHQCFIVWVPDIVFWVHLIVTINNKNISSDSQSSVQNYSTWDMDLKKLQSFNIENRNTTSSMTRADSFVSHLQRATCH